MTHIKLYNTIIAILFSTIIQAQISSTSSLTPQQLVQQVLLGQGVTASNITFTGNASQIAKFNATISTNLGLQNGILLSTGSALTSSANGPQGPNNASGTSTNYGGNGDSDLNTISSVTTNDAAVLEFDFIPASDSLKFRFCFASEEYPEYAPPNSALYNDVFAFLLSGPNPIGGNYLNKNLALIPGTSTPVSINNVNPIANTSFYRNNTNNQIDCEFDGLTIIITAKEAVICGQTYHIKIAIADGGDNTIDSGVFLEAGSFSSIPPILVSNSNTNSNLSDTVIVEDCGVNCIYLIRTANISQKDSFALQVGGTANLGTDYQQIGNPSFAWPSKLIFDVGQDTISICNLIAINDNVIEPTETMLFTLTSYTTSGSSCILTSTINFNIYLMDYLPINIAQGDSLACNGTGITLNAGAQFGVPAYTYSWSPDNSTNASINTGPVTQVKNYTLTVNDICNKPVTKAITITPTTLPKITPVGPYRFCLDTIRKIPINVTDGVPSFNISWQIPSGGIVPFDTINSTYHFVQNSNPSSGTYTVIISDQCNITDTITVDITTVDCKIIVPNVVTPNGDNVNEYFKINALENFSNSQLLIYNRWGKKIYSNDDYKNNWKPDVNSGTYFYILNMQDGRSFNGFFQVFKE